MEDPTKHGAPSAAAQQPPVAEERSEERKPADADELAKAKADLSAAALAKAEAQEYLAGWKRAAADYANFKKEAERAREETAEFAAASFIVKILPVLDSFKKAMAQKPSDAGQAQPWIDGIGAISAQFEAALKSAGVAAIEETGVKFDPSVHEAMLQEKAEGVEPGTVLKVFEPGYKMRGRLLRPAKVVVAE